MDDLAKTRILTAVVLSILLLSGCSGEDEGVTSSNAKGGANAADGSIVDGKGGVGGDAGGTDGDGGGAIDASGGSDGSSADTSSGPKSCAVNKECAATEHCALFYNGVKELTGDDDGKGGKTVPGWANACFATDAKLAKVGELCDPFDDDGDTSLPKCHNASACQQGICTALCTSDSDCPSGTHCAQFEVPIEVKNKGAKAYVLLVASVCVPGGGTGKDCTADKHCSGGEVCRPHANGSQGKLTLHGHCNKPNASKQKLGGTCGSKSDGKGLAKLCASALCNFTQNGAVAGICTAVCSQKSDCPATMSYGGIPYKSVCSSSITATNDPSTATDDVFIPQCDLVNQGSSMTDCTATKTCSGTEACIAFAIARGPGQGTKVEHFCIDQSTKSQPQGPPKATGSSCTPGAAIPQCKGGYCVDGGSGGVCAQTCNANNGCANGTTCKDYTLIARPTANASAKTKLCLK